MKITLEAKEKLEEFLRDYGNGGFVRVAHLSSGGGCSAKLALGVTLDEDKDDEADLAFSLDGLPVVIEKTVYETLKDCSIVLDNEKGITVSIRDQ